MLYSVSNIRRKTQILRVNFLFSFKLAYSLNSGPNELQGLIELKSTLSFKIGAEDENLTNPWAISTDITQGIKDLMKLDENSKKKTRGRLEAVEEVSQGI